VKFLLFSMYEPDKVQAVAEVADKFTDTPGIESVARYVCMGIPFPGFPQNMMLSIGVVEAQNNEAMAAATYPATLAGASIWWVPVLEYEAGAAAQTEKKYRG